MSETTTHSIFMLDAYVDSLSEKERKAYHIAKSHLGSSFSLEKSRGFLDWKTKIDAQSKIHTENA